MYPPLQIGPITVDPPVVLAPMAGVTNGPFRRLCRSFGAGLYVGEMVGAWALLARDTKTTRIATFSAEEVPRSLQLYDVFPDSLGRAVEMLRVEDRVDHIDLNFGCPAPKVTRNGGGAALPWRPDRFRDLVRAAVRNAEHIPVTVKFRMGIDEDHLTYLETGEIAQDEGAVAVALHARTAHQLYSGEAQWDAIAALKRAVDIPVLGNGDIWEASDALAMMEATGCDGVVVGRGCLGRPWLFRDLAAAFAGEEVPPPPDLREIAGVMHRHLELLVEGFGERIGVTSFRKHIKWYLQCFEVGERQRRLLTQSEAAETVLAALDELGPNQPFPEHARRLPRGHTYGPRPVRLPDRFLETRVGDEGLPQRAVVVSGG